jgi:hypothetical protein
MAEKTYPCVVNGRIVELTAEQRAQHEWRNLTPDQKIQVLLGRIERLERIVQEKEAL